jgi:hypothetical protein
MGFAGLGMEQGIGWVGAGGVNTSLLQTAYSGPDNVMILEAYAPIFSCVRIQAGNSNAWCSDGKIPF